MKKIIISFFLIAATFVSVHAVSFDCSKARSYSEKEICSTPELSKKDDLLAALYKKAKAATQDQQAFSSIRNALWMSRERCENTLCLTAWYDSAFAIYEAIRSKGIPTTIGTPTPKGDALTAPESHDSKSALVDNEAEPTAVPFDVSFEVGMDLNDGKPVVRVRTNLPEGTEFFTDIVSPINWGGTGHTYSDTAEVSSTGLAEFGPFTDQGEALPPGPYQVTMTSTALQGQPENVRTVFGQHGKNLTGNKISEFNFGLGLDKYISQKFIFEVHQDGSITVK